MSVLHFSAVIKIRGVNPYVDVSKEQANLLKPDWKKPMPVLVTINGKPKPPWKINMMPVGNGDFYLYLHGEIRKASNIKVGDTVTVDVTFDSSYRNGPLHPMPTWFSKPLKKNPNAQTNWESLSPSRQKEILRYFAGLKSHDARARNAEKALHVLSGKPGRFMGRSWKDGK